MGQRRSRPTAATVVACFAGKDKISGGSGEDTILCGPGSDTVTADPTDTVKSDCEHVHRG
jgi:hypothetical protein